MNSVDLDIFNLIANPVRRAILVELIEGERQATSLAAEQKVSASALSQHLKLLKDAGLVTEHREGRQRIYSLQPERLQEVSDWVSEFEIFWVGKLEALGQHLRRRKDGKEN